METTTKLSPSVYVSKKTGEIFPLTPEETEIDIKNPQALAILRNYKWTGENNAFNVYELRSSNDRPGDLIGHLSKCQITFTQWLIELTALIVRDGTDLEDIAITHNEVMGYYEAGHVPIYVYDTIWDKDGGSFIKLF
jgi:hypothetical protein